MGKVLLILVLAGTGVTALSRPWLGVVAGYLISIMGPQFIWFWVFEGVRPFFWILIPAFIGWAFALASGRLRFSSLNRAVPIFFFLWWLATAVSYLFGPYIDIANANPKPPFYPSETFLAMSIQFGFMFMAMCAITQVRHARYLAYMMAFIVVYMTYWVNDRYLSGLVYGRASGPVDLAGNALYKDENTFAMLFVLGAPFLFYLGLYSKRWYMRYGLWLVIPFTWHAIFLTGSRGGLLGVGVTMLVLALRLRKLGYGLLGLALFGVAYAWQAGGLMKSRAHQIAGYEEDYAATSRLEAWEAAGNMVARHPLTGVGVGAFIQAFPDHAEYHPRATHNTVLEIFAESGVMGGLAWLMIVTYLPVLSLWWR